MSKADHLILVATGAADVHDAVIRALTEAGYRVLSARDGDVAAVVVTEQQPAVIVAALDLPHIRGTELFEIARRARDPLPVAGIFLLSPTDSRAVPEGGLVEALRLPAGAAAIVKVVDRLVAAVVSKEASCPEDETHGRRVAGKGKETGLPATEQTARRSFAGSLTARSFARVLFDAKESELTAHLTVKAGEIEKRLHLLHGRPVNCDSNSTVESLAEMLLADKLLSPKDLELTREQMTAHGGGQAEALLAVEAIDRETLAAAMGRHIRERIINIFSWDRGQWQLDEVKREEIAPFSTDLEPLWLVMEGVRRFTAPGVLLDFYDEKQHAYLVPSAQLGHETPALSALVGGSRVVDLLDGGTTLCEMQRASGLDELLFTQLAMALEASGLVAIETDPMKGEIKPSSPLQGLIGESLPDEALLFEARSARNQDPRTEFQAQEEPRKVSVEDAVHGAGSEAELREEILDLYARLSGSDPFDLLGVDAGVDASGVAEAFANWAARVGPDRISELGDAHLAHLAGEVWLRIEEAYTALADDDGRERWRAERERRVAGDSVKRLRWLDADKAFRIGQEHLKAGRNASAVEAFEAAVTLNRREPVFRLYAAWSGWMAAKDKGSSEAMDSYEQAAVEAVESIPILEEGWVFLGEMALHRGEEDEARDYFKRALIFNPSSRTVWGALEGLENRAERSRAHVSGRDEVLDP